MPKRSIDPLVRGRVRLRMLEEADLPTTRAWRNQEHIRQWFFSDDVISADQHRRWYDSYKARDDDFVFIIEETETLKRPVGQVALYHIDRTAGRAEFGRLMIGDREAEGLGLAKTATSCLVDQALGAWDLREIWLECLTTNARALGVYAACGFQQAERAGNRVILTRRRSNGSPDPGQ
jgi:RimJ/RimL family protein N-acetyltransferase